MPMVGAFVLALVPHFYLLHWQLTQPAEDFKRQ